MMNYTNVYSAGKNTKFNRIDMVDMFDGTDAIFEELEPLFAKYDNIEGSEHIMKEIHITDYSKIPTTLNTAYEMLEHMGYMPNRARVHAEVHRYQIKPGEQYLKSQLGSHMENEGHFRDCISIIFYLRKDTTIGGGGLFYWPIKGYNTDSDKSVLLDTTPPTRESNGKKKKGIRACIMDGNVMNEPQIIIGHGISDCFAIYFETKGAKNRCSLM